MIQSLILLTIQTFAAIISFVAATVVVLVVIFLIATSSTLEDKIEVKHKVYSLRSKYFWGLVSVAIIMLFVSLRYVPYTPISGTPDQTVKVIAMQWAWKMSIDSAGQTEDALGGRNEITLPPNKVIKFDVTSQDVNHNFAIYNDKGDLVAQTQAMPKYHNELEYQFPDTGVYHVLCLEYCGMPHGFMTGKIHVK